MNLVELFSSVQGEGPHVGVSTLFLRLGGCDLRCGWCDSPQTWKPAASFRVETESGSGVFQTLENPISVEAVLELLQKAGASKHEFVSLTGGEPLLQAGELEELSRGLRRAGCRVYLETHGLAVKELSGLVDSLDVVSMDWKLASDVRRESDSARGEVEDFHQTHLRFLQVARRAPEVFVKVVVTPSTSDSEWDSVISGVGSVDPGILLVVQPVTPWGAVKQPVEPLRLLELARRAQEHLDHVRIIPQTHKMLGVL